MCLVLCRPSTKLEQPGARSGPWFMIRAHNLRTAREERVSQASKGQSENAKVGARVMRVNCGQPSLACLDSIFVAGGCDREPVEAGRQRLLMKSMLNIFLFRWFMNSVAIATRLRRPWNPGIRRMHLVSWFLHNSTNITEGSHSAFGWPFSSWRFFIRFACCTGHKAKWPTPRVMKLCLDVLFCHQLSQLPLPVPILCFLLIQSWL